MRHFNIGVDMGTSKTGTIDRWKLKYSALKVVQFIIFVNLTRQTIPKTRKTYIFVVAYKIKVIEFLKDITT